MIIKTDDKILFEITDNMLKVLAYDIDEPDIKADMERRLEWVIMSRYQAAFSVMQAEWLPKLANRGIETIPTNKEKFAELVFSQPDYKSRVERDGVSES